jgi:signal transduction histidine kinase
VLESKSSAKSIDLRVETADDLPAVWGYGNEINQVWQALIDNAIDAVDAQGSVTVTASERGDSVVVRVPDNGPGIPDENSSSSSTVLTTKPVGGGAGLGLHQARRIVNLHQGDACIFAAGALDAFWRRRSNLLQSLVQSTATRQSSRGGCN